MPPLVPGTTTGRAIKREERPRIAAQYLDDIDTCLRHDSGRMNGEYSLNVAAQAATAQALLAIGYQLSRIANALEAHREPSPEPTSPMQPTD